MLFGDCQLLISFRYNIAVYQYHKMVYVCLGLSDCVAAEESGRNVTLIM